MIYTKLYVKLYALYDTHRQINYFEDILLYLHLMPKKMEVANEPTQKIHKITITRHHVPK